MHPANDDVLMAAMIRDMAGYDCSFMRNPPKDIPNNIMPSLNPVCFGSRRYKGYETISQSYSGEGFSVYYGVSKFSHYLWVMSNT